MPIDATVESTLTARPPPMQATGSDGQFERTRVTSTLAPLPVRQHALVPGVATGGRAIHAGATS